MTRFQKAEILHFSRRGLAAAGRLLILLCLLSPPLFAAETVLAPAPGPTPIFNRFRRQREILDLKIRAARQGDSPSVRDQLAGIYLETGQAEKAITLYRHAIIFDPPRAASYHRKIARIYRDLGKSDEAEVELQRAQGATVESEYVRRRRQLASWEEEGKDDLLLQQYRFLYWTQSGLSEQYLRNIARLLARRGEAEEASRYYRLMINDYRKRIDQKPKSAVSSHLRIAAIYAEMEDWEAAAEEYRRAVEREGESGGRALIAEADFYRSRGQAERAQKLYREAQTQPGVDQTSLQLRIAALLEREGMEESALAELRKAAELEDGSGVDIRIRTARHFERHNDPEAALAEYHSILPDLEPLPRSRLWERIGGILSRLGRAEEATRAYQEALKLRESDQEVEGASADFLERALALAEKSGLEDQAADYSRRLTETYRLLLDQDPGRAAYYHRKLGDILRNRGNYRQAAAHYRTWSGLAPADSSPYYRLYRLYRDHLDNPRQAELYLNRYRELRNAESKSRSLLDKPEKVADDFPSRPNTNQSQPPG